MNTSTVKTGTALPARVVTGLDAMTVINEIVSVANQWVQVHETEATKREFIRAQENAVIAEIHARRDLFLTYLDRSFDERERTFAELFRALDRAVDSDPGNIANILGSITALAAMSPFADLTNIDLVKQNLDDPDHVWAV